MKLSKFPFVIHFEVSGDEKSVQVKGLFHAAMNPEDNWENESRHD